MTYVALVDRVPRHMLKIRLQRTGRTNDPSYRIVVVEHTESAKTGNFVEKLGTYNPKTKLRNLNSERIKYWLSVGAKATGTMHNMLISAGVIEGKKVNVLPRKSPPKPESSEAPTPEGVGVPTPPAEDVGKVAESKPADAPDSAKATTDEGSAVETKEETPTLELKDEPKAAEVVAEAAAEQKA